MLLLLLLLDDDDGSWIVLVGGNRSNIPSGRTLFRIFRYAVGFKYEDKDDVVVVEEGEAASF
jgi:hypothetical protein